MRFRTLIAMAALCALALAMFVGDASARKDAEKIAPELAKCENLLRDRSYDKASEALRSFISKNLPGKDYASYLLSIARFSLNDFDGCIKACDTLLSSNPDSKWAMKALGKKAESLYALKKYAESEKVYGELVAKVTDPARRKALATELVTLARKLLYPAGEKKPTAQDYTEAFGLLTQVKAFGSLGADEEQVAFEAIFALDKTMLDEMEPDLGLSGAPLAIGGIDMLVDLVQEFTGRFPASTKIEKLQYTVISYTAKYGSLWDALDKAAAFEKAFPKSTAIPFMLFELAQSDLERYKTSGKDAISSKLLRRIVSEFKDTALAPEAQFALANKLAGDNDPAAIAEYERFAELFPTDDRAPNALFAAAEIAAGRLDYVKAFALLDKVVKDFADAPQRAAYKARRIALEINIIDYLLSSHQYEETIRLANQFETAHPEIPELPRMLLTKATAMEELGKFDETIALYRKLAAKYPNTPESSRALYKIAEIQELKLGDIESAMKSYAIVTGQYQSAAVTKIAAIKTKSFAIASEKTFGAGEKPFVKLTARNIEKMTFKVYAMDVNDFFEKKLSLDDIENLETAVITPEKEWEYSIKDYQKFKEYKLDVEIPFTSRGAYIVTCQDESSVSKTAVLVADLQFIAKMSRKQIKMFGFDAKGMNPFDLKNFLVATDGIILKSPAALPDDRSNSKVSILAEKDGGYATVSAANLSNLAKMPEDGPSAIIVTDKNGYAEGERCSFIVLVRNSAGMLLSAPDKAELMLEIDAKSNQYTRLTNEKLALDEFGMYAGSIETPKNKFCSELQIGVREKATGKLLASANRRTYGLSPIAIPCEPYGRTMTISGVQAVFVTDKSEYYMGDTVNCAVFLADIYGRPYAGREVVVNNGNKDITQITNSQGAITLSIPFTPELRFRKGFSVAVHHNPSIDGDRYIYFNFTDAFKERGTFVNHAPAQNIILTIIKDEPQAVRFAVTDERGKPVSKDLKWTFGRTGAITTADDVGYESSGTARSSTEDGIAEITVRPKTAGNYIVKVWLAEDASKPACELGLTALDATGDRKILIVLPKHEFNLDETIEAKIYSFVDAPLTALVTLEKYEIERSQTIALAKGWNTFAIPLKGIRVRSHFLSVCAMDGNKIHSDTKGISIKTQLEVTAASLKESYYPGEDADIAISVADSAGRPASSDVAVFITEDSVFNAPYPFNDADSNSYFMTLASNLFSAGSSAEEISKEFLLAMDSLEKAKESNKPGFLAPEYEEKMDSDAAYDAIGIGAGSGVKGGRYGGKGAAKSKSAVPGSPLAMPVPLPTMAHAFMTAKTDANGRASVKIKMPYHQAKLNIYVFAISKDSAGVLSKASEVKDSIGAHLVAPEHIWSGDSASSASVFLRNLAYSDTEVEVNASVIIDGKETKAARKVKLGPFEVREEAFELTAAKPGTISFSCKAGNYMLRKDIAVLRYELTDNVTSSGIVTAASETTLELPKDYDKIHSIEVEAYSGLTPLLAKIRDTEFPVNPYNLVYSDDYRIAARAFLNIAFLEHVATTGDETAVKEARAAFDKAMKEFKLMLNSRYPNLKTNMFETGLSWRNNGNSIEVALNALCLIQAQALSTEKADPKILDPIKNTLSATYAAENNPELKAMLLYPLSMLDKTAFSHANRMFREADKLSARGLAFLTLSLSALDKPEMAAETADKMLKSVIAVGGEFVGNLDYSVWVGAFETKAHLAALALKASLKAKGKLPSDASLLNTILAAKKDAMWLDPMENATAAWALNEYAKTYGLTPLAALTVNIDGVAAARSSKENSGFSSNTIEGKPSAKSIKIQLAPEGAGYGFYSVRLIYALEPHKDPSMLMTGFPARYIDGVRMTQYPTDWSRLYANITHKTDAGNAVEIGLKYWHSGQNVILEWELPPGMVPNQALGRTVYAGGRMFTVVPTEGSVIIQELFAMNMGKFVMKPFRIHEFGAGILSKDAYMSSVDFEVLKAGTDIWQTYKLTLSEQLNAINLYFSKKEYSKAFAELVEIYKNPDIADSGYYSEYATKLLICAIDRGADASVVNAFEIIKEKAPNYVLSFEDMAAVEKSYLARKEFQRACDIQLAILESRFLEETSLCGSILRNGDQKKYFELANALVLSYPDTDLICQTHSGLGQQVYDIAQKLVKYAKSEAPETKFDRDEAFDKAAEIFEAWLTLYPANWIADEVSYTLNTLYGKMPDFAVAKEMADLCAARFPESKFLDGFHYQGMAALFGQTKFDEALKACDDILNYKYNDGVVSDPATLRDLVTYLSAQIYHAKGRMDEALPRYKKVMSRYEDAARTVEFLQSKALAMPEVTVCQLAKPAEFEIEYSGVSEASIKAYKIDLMTLMMKYKTLKSSESIELSGTKPLLTAALKFQKPGSLGKEKQKVALAVKEKGAYYVTVKAGDFFTSGIVILSDLIIEAQESPGEGLIRINLTDAGKGGVVEGARVVFMSPEMANYTVTKTDLRGIAEAKDITGGVTVIAEKDKQYAMFKTNDYYELFPQRGNNAPMQQMSDKKANVQEAQFEKSDNLKQQSDFNWQNSQMKNEGVSSGRAKR